MALSQMMTHYLSVKEKYPDCVIFYRLGDFYEMFFEDAKKVSKILELTLTGRDCGLDERAPMCGVPYHAAEGYIAKLVEAGEKVAICEQLTDPKETKGLVERDVVRVVSAGTLIEDSMLEEGKSNYLASLMKTDTQVGVAWTDITTGEFFAELFEGDSAMEKAVCRLMKISAVEIICNEEGLFASKRVKEIQNGLLPHFSCYASWSFNEKHAEKNLLTQFGTASLSAYGIADKPCLISACGGLIEYLRDTQKHALQNISNVKVINCQKFLELDTIAVRNLELERNNSTGKKYGSLYWLLDKTKTGMGTRLMKDWILYPLKDEREINYRLDGVEELFSASVSRLSIVDTLQQVKDVARLSGKISNGNLTPRDCLALASSLQSLPTLKFQLAGFSSAVLTDLNANLLDMRETADLLVAAIAPDAPALMKDGGYIKEGFSPDLDELRAIEKNGRTLVLEVEARERERTDIKNLKVGFNRVFGYYIEITNSFKDKAPADYIRKQTLSTGERYITEELKQLEEKILTSGEKALKLESALYHKLVQALAEQIDNLKTVSSAIAVLDCLCSFAGVSKERRYVRPAISPSGTRLSIVEGRHPVVEEVSKERFVPNDTVLDNEENKIAIITGPNMAGKSTYMRQVALITLMAHIGCFVPAKSAQIPITDKIFTRVGASDNLIFDQSTFMVEMTEVASILLNATKDSLLVLDEVGRGTSTYDGLSIAWAVVEQLAKKTGAKTLFATHYHELTELEDSLEGVKNYRITIRELGGDIVFLRKIVRGGANRSFGIEVAALAGVPKEVTLRAKAILKELEKKDCLRTGTAPVQEEEKTDEAANEIRRILEETDVNTLSPMQALMLLADLKEKIER